MLRLALDPEGRPFVDILGRAPGRGVYVEPEALTEALGPKAMGRAFRGKAKTLTAEEIEAVIASTRTRLEARILELFGLCRRAGGVTVGMDAVLGDIERGKARVVVLAKDLSDRSRDRVIEGLAGTGAERRTVPRYFVATVAEIGHALGRDVVGIVAIGHPVFASRVVAEAERLERLSPADATATAERKSERRARGAKSSTTRGKTTDG